MLAGLEGLKGSTSLGKEGRAGTLSALAIQAWAGQPPARKPQTSQLTTSLAPTHPAPCPFSCPPCCAVVAALLSSLDDPALALVQWNEVYGVVQDRLPAAVAVELETCVTGGWQGGQRHGGGRDRCAGLAGRPWNSFIFMNALDWL